MCALRDLFPPPQSLCTTQTPIRLPSGAVSSRAQFLKLDPAGIEPGTFGLEFCISTNWTTEIGAERERENIVLWHTDGVMYGLAERHGLHSPLIRVPTPTNVGFLDTSRSSLD